MLRLSLCGIVCLFLLALAVGSSFSAEKTNPIRMVAPSSGATIVQGDLLTVELSLDESLKGSPFSVRLDGKSIWVGQQVLTGSLDTSQWGEGRHRLEAAVFRGDEEIISPVVWVQIIISESDIPLPPPSTENETEPSLEIIVEEAIPEAPIVEKKAEALVSDAFEGESINRDIWSVTGLGSDLKASEGDNELRMWGESKSDFPGRRVIQLRQFFEESAEASIWFRAPDLNCAEAGVSLLLVTDRTEATFTFNASSGYTLMGGEDPSLVQTISAFGDEADEWHQLRFLCNLTEQTVKALADNKVVGAIKLPLTKYSIGFTVSFSGKGCSADVRFDDFSVTRLSKQAEAEALPPPAEVAEEEPKWEREPFLTEDDPLVPGEIVERHTAYGDYFEYVPLEVSEPARVVVVVHGSEGDDKMSQELSRFMAREAINDRGWLLLADKMGVIIVAPSFDRDRFFGYRFLGGSPIGADRFVLKVVDSYAEDYPSADGKLYLFGHSAGGQFVNRFLLVHPDRVLAAVISSAGTFAYPDETVDWPFGMRGAPNPDGFLEATQIPAQVIVGTQDNTDISEMGLDQRGSTHLERGQTWVEAMRQYAEDQELESSIELVVIPGATHSAWALDMSSVLWLGELMNREAVE